MFHDLAFPASCRLASPCRTVALLGVLIGASHVAADVEVPYLAPEKLGEVEHEAVRESSGLAISRRADGILWTHNDSGDGPVLYAFDKTGAHRGAVMLDGVWAIDWEDLAGAVLDDQPTLVVGDIGDNPRKRRRIAVYFIEEPTLDDAQLVRRDQRDVLPKVEPAAIHLTYPDRAYDAESLAIDPARRQLYLITKQFRGDNRPTAVFRADLPEQIDEQTIELTKIADLRYRAVTAADMSPDARRLVILSLGAAYVYFRAADEDWADALQRAPQRVRIPALQQGEAIAFGADGRTLYLTSEQRPTPVWRIPVEAAE